MPTPTTLPMKIPTIGRLTRSALPRCSHHRPGTYCDTMMMLMAVACAAKATSLNCTVGVSPWLRAAYCWRMVGE